MQLDRRSIIVRKRVRLALAIICGLILLVGVGVLALYKASQHVPEFYRKALDADPAVQRQASDQMLQRTSTLVSDVNKKGRWEALFTADEINGWLAVDLVKNHPGLLPQGVGDPRVTIQPDQLSLACRIQSGNITSIVSLTIEAYLEEPNVVALRIRNARAGLVPLPLEGILDRIAEATSQLDYRIEWRQARGDPVALISIPPPRGQRDKLVRIETLQLGQGEIYLAGSTE